MSNFKLPTKFTFWLQEGNTVKYELYSQSLKAIATFSEVKQFWEFFQYLKKPSDLPNGDMYIFKEGLKPEWEDKSNTGGGFFKMRIEKKRTNKLWQNSVFSMISPKNPHIDTMNGIRIKIRENYDELQLWMNSGVMEKEKIDGIKGYLKENMQITDQRAFNVIPFASKK